MSITQVPPPVLRELAAAMRRADGCNDFDRDEQQYQQAATNWLVRAHYPPEEPPHFRVAWHSISCACGDCLLSDYIYTKYADEEETVVSFDRA